VKLYIVTCQKLSKKQQFVQGTHAALEYSREHGLDRHPILVMLQSSDIKFIKEQIKTYRHSEFRDSYYGHRLTAVASMDIGEIVKDLRLI